MKKQIYTLLSAMSMLLVLGCSQEHNIDNKNDDPGETIELELTGKWEYTNSEGVRIAYLFNDNSTGETQYNNDVYTFSWSISDNNISFVYDEDSYEEVFKYTIANGLLTFYDGEEVDMVLSSVKPDSNNPDWVRKYWKRDGVDTYIDLSSSIPVFCVKGEVSTDVFGGYFSQVSWTNNVTGYFTWFTYDNGNFTFKIEKNNDNLVVSTYDVRLDEFYDEASYKKSDSYPCADGVDPNNTEYNPFTLDEGGQRYYNSKEYYTSGVNYGDVIGGCIFGYVWTASMPFVYDGIIYTLPSLAYRDYGEAYELKPFIVYDQARLDHYAAGGSPLKVIQRQVSDHIITSNGIFKGYGSTSTKVSAKTDAVYSDDFVIVTNSEIIFNNSINDNMRNETISLSGELASCRISGTDIFITYKGDNNHYQYGGIDSSGDIVIEAPLGFTEPVSLWNGGSPMFYKNNLGTENRPCITYIYYDYYNHVSEESVETRVYLDISNVRDVVGTNNLMFIITDTELYVGECYGSNSFRKQKIADGDFTILFYENSDNTLLCKTPDGKIHAFWVEISGNRDSAPFEHFTYDMNNL